MDMFEKGETKESLTEHLYTVIHQNEVRKAKKLVELMEKLTMEVSPEEMELTVPVIPQLVNLSACSTFHNPDAHKSSSSSPGEHTQGKDETSQTVVTSEPDNKQNVAVDQNADPVSVDQAAVSQNASADISQNASTSEVEETNNNQICQEKQEHSDSVNSSSQSVENEKS